jgi:trimeric autotransporter adhesin
MAISFVGQNNNLVSTAVSNPTLTLTVPTGTLDGHLMVAIVGFENDSGGTTINTPAGWTKVGEVQTGTSTAFEEKLALYYRYASGETAGTTTYNWTSASSVVARVGGGIVTLSGVAATNPEDAALVTGSNSTGLSIALAGITTVTDGAWVVGGMVQDSATSETIVAPTGFTERWQTAGRRTQHSDKEQATAGATGTVTWTQSPGVANLSHAALLWAIRPDVGGGGGGPAPPAQGPRVWQPRYRRVA